MKRAQRSRSARLREPAVRSADGANKEKPCLVSAYSRSVPGTSSRPLSRALERERKVRELLYYLRTVCR